MLGAMPALLGKNAAYAITVAVERNITEHYNDQVRNLIEMIEEEKNTKKLKSSGGEDASSQEEDDGTEAILAELKDVFKQFRDEEQEHLETGLNKGAEQAPFYDTITSAVGVGCKAAIWASERV